MMATIGAGIGALPVPPLLVTSPKAWTAPVGRRASSRCRSVTPPCRRSGSAAACRRRAGVGGVAEAEQAAVGGDEPVAPTGGDADIPTIGLLR